MNLKLKILLPVVILLFQAVLFAQDVPFVPTSAEVVKGMLNLADVTEKDVVYDLGCGDGRIVVAAARDFGARGVGVDSNPQRIAESNDNAKVNNVTDKVKFIEQDLFEADIKDATVIAIYLLNSVNLKLRPKLLNELEPGSRVVSHAFDMDDWEADGHEVIDGRDIYLWIIPENASGSWNVNGNKNNTMQVEQQFQKLSGILSADGKNYNFNEGRIKGNEISFRSEDGEMEFKGKVNGDKITAKLTSGSGPENKEIVLQRREGTKKPLETSVTMEQE